MKNISTKKSISIFVKDSHIINHLSNYYERTNDRLRLTMSSGGIIPGAMLVDLLEITGKK